MAKYLGKSFTNEQIRDLNEWCSFESMKTKPTTSYDWHRESGYFIEEGSFYRKGAVGDWVNYFTRDEAQQFDKVINENLKHKLDFDARPIEEQKEEKKI